MPRLINWDLAGNPLNWLVVLIMVAAPAIVMTVYRSAQNAKQS